MATSMSSTSNPNVSDSPTNRSEASRRLEAYLKDRSRLPIRFVDPDDGRPSYVAVSKHGDGLASETEFSDNYSLGTYQLHEGVLAEFVHRFGSARNVRSFTNVDKGTIRAYKSWLDIDRDLADTTIHKRLRTLRTFFKWLRDASTVDVHDSVIDAINYQLENVEPSDSEKSRANDPDHFLSSEEAESVREHLIRFERASRSLAVVDLILHCGLRMSALLSLQVDDVCPKKNIVQIRNRPEKTGAMLKKRNDGERDVNVKPEVMDRLVEYIDHGRVEPSQNVDETDHGALLTTMYGRPDDSTIHRDVAYAVSEALCDCDRSKKNATKCDTAIGPHDLRRTGITIMRDKGLAWETIAQRVNTSKDMLQRHYDTATYTEEAARRRDEVLSKL